MSLFYLVVDKKFHGQHIILARGSSTDEPIKDITASGVEFRKEAKKATVRAGTAASMTCSDEVTKWKNNYKHLFK